MRDNETINTYNGNNYSWEEENGDTFSLINSYFISERKYYVKGKEYVDSESRLHFGKFNIYFFCNVYK